MAIRPIYKRNNVSKIEGKEKIQKSSLHPLIYTPPISYTNPSLISMTILILKLLPFFCHGWQRASKSSRHLIIIRRAIIIIIISMITAGAIVTLILKGWWRWRGSDSETTHNRLLSCDATNMGVHLTQLIVKPSIHAHKLCHDGLKCHSTRWR